MRRKKPNRITVVLISLGVLGVVALKSIPYFIDKEAIKKAIEEGLHESTGVNFRIRELRMDPTLFHGIQVQLNTSTITNMKHQPLGSVGNITIQIRYLPIITQQLPEIAKIHLNHVLIPVGTNNFFKELHLKLIKPKRTGFLKPAEMRDTEVLLSDYVIEDRVLSRQVLHLLPAAKGFAVRGNKLSLKHLQSKKDVSVLGDGVITFIPGNAWLAQAPSHLAGKAVETSEAVNYKLMVEVPQAVVTKGKLSASGLSRLEVNLTGGRQDLKLTYRKQNGWPKQSPFGRGYVQSPGLEVIRGQVLAMQLGDTFGLPVPSALSQAVVAGTLNLDSRFELAFPTPNQANLRWLEGKVGFNQLAVAPSPHPDRPWLGALSGTVNLLGNRVQADRLQFALAGLPLTLQGWYRLDNQQLGIQVSGQNLQEQTLKNSLPQFGVSSSMLQGLDVQGVMDAQATVQGTLNQPFYQGYVVMRNGKFQDQTQGLEADHLTGKVQFKGAGFKKPVVQYAGLLAVADGHLINAKQGVNVQHFDGKVAFNGKYQPGPSIPLPQYNGQVDIKQAQYQDPKTGLLVSDIQGVLRLGESLIHLDHFHGLFAGSTYTASGQIKQDLKDYSVNVKGEHIDLPRLKREVAPKFPAVQEAMRKLEPENGQANLDLTVSTGLNLKGRLDVSSLAIRTGQPNYPIRLPQAALVFNNQTVTLPKTYAYVGQVPIELNGEARENGQYGFNVVSGEVPISVIRDNESLIRNISGLTLPEIWNTDGSMTLRGRVASQGSQFAVNFKNAGLSWQGGDFPIYNLNGSLAYQQTGNQTPTISSRDLNFRYGNSPVALSLDNHGQLNAIAEGVFSSLAVNHFLVSRQSEATPYQAVPFQVSVNGVLGGLSSPMGSNGKALQSNDIRAYLHFNLDQNFRNAYTGVVETPAPATVSTTQTPTQPAAHAASGSMLSGIKHPVRTVGHVLSAAHQTVQAGLDTLIGTTKATADILPSLGKKIHERLESVANGTSSENAGAQSPIASPMPGDTGAAFASASLHWKGSNLDLDQAVLHLFDAGDIQANGRMQNFMIPSKQLFTVHVSTQPGLDLAKLSQGASHNLFFHDSKGTVAMDLQMAGNGEGPKLARGWISTNHVGLPYLTLRDLTSRVVLQGETADAVVDNFEIPGVSASMTGRTANVFEVPVTLEDVKIHGNQLSIDSLGQFTSQIVQPILVDQIAHNYLRPWQQGDPTIPIQFRNADLRVDEVIYQNIILSNLTSQFSLYPNSFFELTNASLQAAGGEAHGYLSMSPNDSSFTTLDLNVDKVKANALTKALLNVTNQIFGDVDGAVRFTTFGDTPVDMQKNANGTVSMHVINGRLPAIAKVETLLTTANIIRGGILGFNLNNLLRSLTIYDTNYFATLSGDMLINNQVLYTRNLSSFGTNLDLLIRGSVRMDNGNANLLVDGRMRQVVAGKLGALGTLSLGGLVQYIPALGTFGNNRKGLLGYIPGVGWVPGFGGPAGDVNRFRVRLVGDLNTPGAIQDFHWVH